MERDRVGLGSGSGLRLGPGPGQARDRPRTPSASPVAPEDTRSVTTVCMEIRTEPADRLGEFEKAAVLTVARTMAALHYPQTVMNKWYLEEEEEPQPHYNIVTEFPRRTPFSVAHLFAVESVSPCLVSDVWVQPEDDKVLLCASVRKGSASGAITIDEIRIVRRTVSQDSRKRNRVV